MKKNVNWNPRTSSNPINKDQAKWIGMSQESQAQLANKYAEKCSMPLAIGVMTCQKRNYQIKIKSRREHTAVGTKPVRPAERQYGASAGN